MPDYTNDGVCCYSRTGAALATLLARSETCKLLDTTFRNTRRKSVRRTLGDHEFRRCRNQAERVPQLIDRAKRISCAVHKQRSRPQLWKVIGAKLHRLTWRMQRIREQQQRIGKLRPFRRD